MVKNVNDEQVKAILYGNTQKKSVRPEKTKKAEPAKPYERPTAKLGATKAPDGAWTHDLFRNSLADRMSPSSGGAGKRDLLAGQARSGGMASDDLLRQPARNQQNSRGGSSGKHPVELLAGPTRTPSRTLGGPVRPVVPRQQSAGRGASTRGPRELLGSEDVSMRADEPSSVRQELQTVRQESAAAPMSIRSRPVSAEVTVRVDGLVAGTSESDVKHAFSQHFTIISASLTTELDPSGRPAAKDTISAELVFPTRAEGEKMVGTFNGIVADGNKLAVYIVEPPAPVLVSAPVPQKLSERMGFSSSSGSSAGPLSGRIGGGAGAGGERSLVNEPKNPEKKRENRGNLLNHAMRGATGREVQMGQADLLESGGIGKMYSDTILQTDPYATVITLEEEEEARAVARQGQAARGSNQNQRRDRAPRGRGSLTNRLGGDRAQKAGGGRQGGQSLASRLS